ncbi:hypothetical protein ACF3N0_00140 [Moraxella atlantae]|uniref:hypothetical protein n=1 Tax=Faucicola atlantae TaxID=34059 RepID=UPI003751175E
MGIKALWNALTGATVSVVNNASDSLAVTGDAVLLTATSMSDYAALLQQETAKQYLGLDETQEFDFEEYAKKKRTQLDNVRELARTSR